MCFKSVKLSISSMPNSIQCIVTNVVGRDFIVPYEKNQYTANKIPVCPSM